eukprot:EG_transcript_10181
MHPSRSCIAHSLVQAYGLHQYLAIKDAPPVAEFDLKAFHSAEFVDCVRRLDRDKSNDGDGVAELEDFGLTDDCPPVEGCYDYMCKVAGGTIYACEQLAAGACSVALHWDGGRHHAHSAEARGFCYVNDVVLGALRLLESYSRVMVIDIDAHHGDGTETAFYDTDRVFTFSSHAFGPGVYPGSGRLEDVGEDEGKYYNVNVPFADGVDDPSFLEVVLPVLEKAHAQFQPEAVILLCGADGLAGDRLGLMNLSLASYIAVAWLVRGWALPTLVLGGGGYTVANVARCWAAVTAVFCRLDSAANFSPLGTLAPSATSAAAASPESDAAGEEPLAKKPRLDSPVPVCPELAVAKAALGTLADDDVPEEPGGQSHHWEGAELVLAPDIPCHAHLATYAPDFRLAVAVPEGRALKNHNSPASLRATLATLLNNLDHVTAPQ